MAEQSSFEQGTDINKSEVAEHSAQGAALDAPKLFEEYRASIARISHKVALGPNVVDDTRGTGFVIDRQETKSGMICRVATDNHVLTEATPPASLYMPNGQSYPVVVELRDEKNDLAILRVDGLTNPDQCQPIRLSSAERPVQADQALLKMSAKMGVPQYSQAIADEYFTRKDATGLELLTGEDPERQMISLKSQLGWGQSGDSGGPVLDGAGVAVAVIDAEGPGVTGTTPSHYLLDDLKKLNAPGGRTQKGAD